MPRDAGERSLHYPRNVPADLASLLQLGDDIQCRRAVDLGNSDTGTAHGIDPSPDAALDRLRQRNRLLYLGAGLWGTLGEPGAMKPPAEVQLGSSSRKVAILSTGPGKRGRGLDWSSPDLN
jgi:hypothetical protein